MYIYSLQVARVVSFSSSSSLSHSYYMMAAGNAVEIGRDFQLTMTVKTEEKDGLLMVAMNNDQVSDCNLVV